MLLSNLFRNQNHCLSQNTVHMVYSCSCLLLAVADRHLHQNLVPHQSAQFVLVLQHQPGQFELVLPPLNFYLVLT